MALEYVNCRRCGNVFLKGGLKDVCPECQGAEEKEFEKVKNYLYDYPNASLEEVAAQTEIPRETIYEWVRIGRIETKGVAMNYSCSICGRPIHTGQVCDKCLKALGTGANNYKSEKEKEDSDKISKGKYDKNMF